MLFFGRTTSLAMSYAAVVAVFAAIPILSEYAFWVLVGAYLLWLAVHRLHRKRARPLLMVSIVLILAAIVGVFIEIPIVSNYAFWVMAANYLLVVAATSSNYFFVFTTS
jgi:multidrug transporter EmrE-like cation transporter